MRHLVEVVVPARLGIGYRLLLASSWTTNLGDGISLAAGPLLVASLTSDPFLISLAALLRWAPQLVFSLHAGVLSDRVDRRLILIVVNLARAAAFGVLAVVLLGGPVPVGAALLALALVATTEVFADNTSATLPPMLVARDDLTVANARLQTGFITLNQLIGPPIGAALFTAGRAWPFLADAVLMVLAVTILARVPLPTPDRPGPEDRSVRREIVEGVRWTVRHPAVRTLTLTILAFNVTFGADWSVLVLYASEQLGLRSVGFGLLTTAAAIGGLLGTLLYGPLTRRFSLGDLMRIGLVIETLTHLVLAVTRSPAVAVGMFVAFGAHTFVWGTTETTVRHRVVPAQLLGRVGGVHSIATFGGLVVGSVIGGTLATRFGVTAPFWFAFVGSAVLLALLWRELARIAHDQQRDQQHEQEGRGR